MNIHLIISTYHFYWVNAFIRIANSYLFLNFPWCDFYVWYVSTFPDQIRPRPLKTCLTVHVLRRARTSFLHCSVSLAFLSSSLHVWPMSFMSDSTVLLQVVFGRPCYLLPSGVHLRDTLVMLFVGFLSKCPIHRQRYFLRIPRTLMELVISCRFSFEILTGQNILSILHRQPLWKLESLLMFFLVILQHSAPYNRTGRT